MTTATTTLSVPSIHCDNCKNSIEGAVGGLDGVSTASGLFEAVLAVLDDDTPSALRSLVG